MHLGDCWGEGGYRGWYLVKCIASIRMVAWEWLINCNRTMSETLLAKGAFFEWHETRARGDIIRLEKLPGRRGDSSAVQRLNEAAFDASLPLHATLYPLSVPLSAVRKQCRLLSKRMLLLLLRKTSLHLRE